MAEQSALKITGSRFITMICAVYGIPQDTVMAVTIEAKVEGLVTVIFVHAATSDQMTQIIGGLPDKK